jgi:hypothetical protein
MRTATAVLMRARNVVLGSRSTVGRKNAGMSRRILGFVCVVAVASVLLFATGALAPSRDGTFLDVGVLSTVGAPALTVDDAQAAFGDSFGMAPINGTPGGTADTSVVFTDATGDDDYAFWAGACDCLMAFAPGRSRGSTRPDHGRNRRDIAADHGSG